MMGARRTAMRGAVAVTGGLLLAMAVISHRSAAEPPPTQVLRLAPIADTYVDSASPATSFHASARLRVSGSPARTSYLRFRVSGVNGRSVEHARLRLGVRNASRETGGTVHVITDGAWEESTLTYANHPAVDGPGLDTLGPVAVGAVVEFALDGAIAGDGLYDLAIDSPARDGVAYLSSTARRGPRPVLLLTVSERPKPALAILQPPPGATFFAGDPVTLQGRATDA